MEQHFEKKGTDTHLSWVPLVRIALGFLLVWKGLAFIENTSQLEMMIERTGAGGISTGAEITAAVVGIVTMLSGIFISVGFFTRPVAFLQIMIVGAGIIFLSVANVARSAEDVFATIVVLVLLTIYGVKGSGRVSFDQELERVSDTHRTYKT